MSFRAHTFIASVSLAFVITAAAHATTYYVNGACGNNNWTGLNEVCAAPGGPKRTIGAAVLAAVDGDTILVAPGTYNESVNFSGKTISLVSMAGPEVTIIDGSGIDDSVVLMISGEGPETLLEGFTIRNGVGHVLFDTHRRAVDCV